MEKDEFVFYSFYHHKEFSLYLYNIYSKKDELKNIIYPLSFITPSQNEISKDDNVMIYCDNKWIKSIVIVFYFI